MMTEEEYNERERMVEKVKSFFFGQNEVVSFLAFFTNSGGKKKPFHGGGMDNFWSHTF